MDDENPTSLSTEVFSDRIIFEVPSRFDFERIIGLKNFTSLWNVGSANTQVTGANRYQISASDKSDVAGLRGLSTKLTDISRDELQDILKHLWVVVAVTLVISSLMFIGLSVYFHRKLVKWKKCNKHNKSQTTNNFQQKIWHESLNLVTEFPPCYTIATGLPTYREALEQRNENQLGYLRFISFISHVQQQYSQRTRQQQEGIPKPEKKSDDFNLELNKSSIGEFEKIMDVVTSEENYDNSVLVCEDIISSRQLTKLSQNSSGENILMDVLVLS